MTDRSRILPAEWARQSAVLLTWPHEQSDWKPWLDTVEPVFVHIAAEIAKRERVIISALNTPHGEHIHALLRDAGVPDEQVTLQIVPSNDTWVRDHGPITVFEDNHPKLLDFTFNGWGRKFDARLDNEVTRHLHGLGAFGDTELETLKLVLEGGSIDSDGEGTLLTTSECLLSPERNPQYDCIGYEGLFAKIFGTKRVLWLKHGELLGDDTDGHVDTLARFCDTNTIAYVSCDDPDDPHYESLKKMQAQLKQFRTADGSPYRLVALPLPAARFSEDGEERLPATHANFLIINGAVLVPVYDDPTDAIALERLADAFPDREIVPVNALPLIRQYGSLHCVTMQLPADVS